MTMFLSDQHFMTSAKDENKSALQSSLAVGELSTANKENTSGKQHLKEIRAISDSEWPKSPPFKMFEVFILWKIVFGVQEQRLAPHLWSEPWNSATD